MCTGSKPLVSEDEVYIAKTFKTFLMNHWPECHDVWHGTFSGQGDQDCSNEVLVVTNGQVLRGHNFLSIYIAKTFKNLLLMNH